MCADMNVYVSCREPEPSRVAALQRETARIREAQQLRLAQSTAASKKNTRKSKPQ